MEGTTLGRVTRVVERGLRHPLEAAQYLSHLPLWKSTPIDLRLPWFSYGAIHELNRWLRKEHSVFEFGSGGSTIFLAQRARQVVAVENDANWLQRVQARSQELALANIDYRYHPLDLAAVDDYQSSSYFAQIRAARYDLIVIDGYCGYETSKYGKVRPFCFDLAVDSIQPGGVIVVDDVWMFPELVRRLPADRVRVFEGLGPCRYGVTSTALFYF